MPNHVIRNWRDETPYVSHNAAVIWSLLPRAVAMALVRQDHQPGGGAMPFEGAKEPLALDRKRAGVVVRLAVDEQDRHLQLVRRHEGGHADVGLRRFPERPLLGLEAEGR